VLSRYVIFDEISLLKSTISQRVKTIKIKDVSQQVDVDATLPCPIGSVLVGISLNMTLSRNHVTILDVEQVEKDVKLFVAIRIKLNLRK